MCKTTTATTTKRVPQKATFTHSVFVYPLGGTFTSVKVLCVAIATLGVIFIVRADAETKKKYNNNAREKKNTLIVWWCISCWDFFFALVIVDGLFSGVARVSTFSVWFVISYEDFATLYTWLGCFLSFSRSCTGVKVFHVVPGTQKSDTRLYRNIKISINTQCSIELHTFQVFCCMHVCVSERVDNSCFNVCHSIGFAFYFFTLYLALPCSALLYRFQKIHFQTISLCDNANWLDKHHSIIDAWINVLFFNVTTWSNHLCCFFTIETCTLCAAHTDCMK